MEKSSEISVLEKKILAIEARNQKVESDKAWETSYTRNVSVALLTYLVMVLFMNSLGVDNSWKSALVPTLGFTLSTLSLPYFKKFWLKYLYNRSTL